MYRTLFGVILGIFFITGIAVGQSFSNEPNITITANPADPEPGEEVSFKLDSYETNLDLAYIIWQSGNLKKEGYGEKEFILNAPTDEKSASSITAEITLTNGTKITKEASISSKSYDLIWEALDSKAPPFYLGKKIPIRENTVRVSVINPKNSNPKQTAYYWSRNGKSVQSSSGSGKSFIDIKNTELEKSENISVSIVDDSSQATRSTTVNFSSPKVLFYEYTALFGLMTNKKINDQVLGYENSTSILAVPLGINKKSKIDTTWTLSRNVVNNQENPYLLSFRVPDESGVVLLSIKIENALSFYQIFNGSLNINY